MPRPTPILEQVAQSLPNSALAEHEAQDQPYTPPRPLPEILKEAADAMAKREAREWANAMMAIEVPAVDDPLFDEAVRIVRETRKASISGVQRRLKIGYDRAARLVETMEAKGLVSPLQSDGSRKILE